MNINCSTVRGTRMVLMTAFGLLKINKSGMWLVVLENWSKFLVQAQANWREFLAVIRSGRFCRNANNDPWNTRFLDYNRFHVIKSSIYTNNESESLFFMETKSNQNKTKQNIGKQNIDITKYRNKTMVFS